MGANQKRRQNEGIAKAERRQNDISNLAVTGNNKEFCVSVSHFRHSTPVLICSVGVGMMPTSYCGLLEGMEGDVKKAKIIKQFLPDSNIFYKLTLKSMKTFAYL